jgi:ABC-type uncharacterized transport system permease subunit
MDLTLNFVIVVLPLLYLLAAVGYGFIFFSAAPRARRVMPLLLRFTLVLHLCLLVLLTLRWQQFPAATVAQGLSAMAFAVAVVYAFVEWHGGETSTGLWMVSLACLFEVFSSLLRVPVPPDREIFHSPAFSAHAGFGLLGYAALAVAAGYGFLFLRLYSELKRRRFSLFFGKLPPLQVLERMMTGALLAGFVALSGAMLSGILWAESLDQAGWFSDPRILVTMVIWAFYGLVLALRQLHQWHGRQTALACLVGLVVIMLSVVGVNLLFSGSPGFH